MNHLRYYFFIGLLTLQFIGCDDYYQSSIPDYYVNLQLNITSVYSTETKSYISLKNNPYHYITYEKRINQTDGIGYGGILVFCRIADSGYDYSAYYMSCPYEHKQTTKVKPNNIGQAICDSCGTVYDISSGFGQPISGPAKETLKRYKTSLSGDILYITR